MREDVKLLVRVALDEFADMVAEALRSKVYDMIKDCKPKSYTHKEVARMLHVSEQTLSAYVMQGKLCPLNGKIKGRGRIYDAVEIERVMSNGSIRKFARA